MLQFAVNEFVLSAEIFAKLHYTHEVTAKHEKVHADASHRTDPTLTRGGQ